MNCIIICITIVPRNLVTDQNLLSAAQTQNKIASLPQRAYNECKNLIDYLEMFIQLKEAH